MPPRVVDGSDHDEVAVTLIMAGRRPAGPVRAHDRAEVIRRMAAAGYSDGQIAYALGTWRRVVLRIRTKLEIPPGLPRGSNRADLVHSSPIRPQTLG